MLGTANEDTYEIKTRLSFVDVEMKGEMNADITTCENDITFFATAYARSELALDAD